MMIKKSRWSARLSGLVLVALISFGLCSQAAGQSVTLSGYVEDARSGERLVGASLYEMDRQVGATTNAHGFFSLTLPAGKMNLRISYVGYRADTLAVVLEESIHRTFLLTPQTLSLDEVSVTATAGEAPRPDQVRLTAAEIESIPTIMGEPDVLKALQLLPGVQSGSEGSSGLYIRGGSPDQNLILLDGAPVYNASHLFGFFSVFNTDAIQSVNLIKGGFPARYGGRLSSVVDITMKEGNLKKLTGTGMVGLLASRLMLEGPIIKDRSSFAISGRRTYLDLITGPFINEDDQNQGYYFYDLNAKANYIFSEGSRLYASTYLGRDQGHAYSEENFPDIKDTADARLGWGNLTSTLRWTRLFSPKLFLSTSVFYSRYQLKSRLYQRSEEKLTQDTTVASLSYRSGITDWSGRFDVDYTPWSGHALKAGASLTHHTYQPGATHHVDRSSSSNQDTTLVSDAPTRAVEVATYLEDDIQITPALSANVGVHVSGFLVDGTRYFSAQPRAMFQYQLPPDWTVHGSVSTMRQYIHLLSNAGIGLPTDLWVPATKQVRPQDAVQVTLGLSRFLKDRQYEVSLIGYLKNMRYLIEYRDGASFIATGQDWQDQVEHGDGRSYGLEVFVQKRQGRTSGWLGYTFSRTTRQFEEVNFGRSFPFRYDRRHDVSLVLNHQLTARRKVSLTWVYGTGNAITVPVARYYRWGSLKDDLIVYKPLTDHYESRNGVRMRPFHRLDVAYRIRYDTRWGQGELGLGLYNAYNRKNPLYMYLTRKSKINEVTGAYTTRDVYKQISLFPILPFISYSFSF